MERFCSGSARNSARDWLKLMEHYREPQLGRSAFEIVITAVPFAISWWLAWAALAVGYLLTLFFCLVASGFLVRLFLIQHDCGHGAFFRRKRTNDWVGRAIGVFTLTPYDVWRRSHALHHATSGNLARRGYGDIETLTISEFKGRSLFGRLCYRIYRHPLVLFGIGPLYLFLIQNRLPVGFMRSGWLYWVSAMATNLAIAVTWVCLAFVVGVDSFFLVQLPIVAFAASAGVWLFYVQHQFEDTFWAQEDAWQVHDAALYGSSYYVLPGWLNWLTADIGAHHVHHLYSRIPYYRLSRVLRDHPELRNVRRVSFRESLGCINLRLWDEDRQRLVSFRDAGC